MVEVLPTCTEIFCTLHDNKEDSPKQEEDPANKQLALRSTFSNNDMRYLMHYVSLLKDKIEWTPQAMNFGRQSLFSLLMYRPSVDIPMTTKESTLSQCLELVLQKTLNLVKHQATSDRQNFAQPHEVLAIESSKKGRYSWCYYNY